MLAGRTRRAPHFSCSAKKSRQKKAARTNPPANADALTGALTAGGQSGGEKKLASLRQFFAVSPD
jgi:hypothetical protein